MCMYVFCKVVYCMCVGTVFSYGGRFWRETMGGGQQEGVLPTDNLTRGVLLTYCGEKKCESTLITKNTQMTVLIGTIGQQDPLI
jgi:hypothetical protein